jgi:hypothetical protein
MKDIAGIVVADVTGEMGMGKYTGRRMSPRHDEIAQLAFSLYEDVAGRTDTTSKIGCVPNRNSCGTMPSGEVPDE